MATSWMLAKDMRSLASFDKKSQEILRKGGKVTAGDGRVFQLMNGHLVSVGSTTWKIGEEIRAGKRDAAGKPAPAPARPAATAPAPAPPRPTVPTIGAPKPTQDVPKPRDLTPTPTATAAPAFVPVADNPVTPTIPTLGPVVIQPDGTTRHQPQDVPVSFSGDAFATIKGILADYGLESLAGFVRDSLVEGKSEAEIMFELRDRPEFKAEFPEIELRKKEGLAALSPGEIVSYRARARQLFRAAGLPEGFYDSKDDFTRFLVNDVSLAELNDRIQLGRTAMFTSTREEIEVLRRDYLGTGLLGEGDLIAFFLDPERAQPLLEKQAAAAKIGGAAKRTGFGATTRGQNERLAELGVTPGQAEQGFGGLVESRQLFSPIDRGEDVITTEEQLGAAFEGNAASRRKIEQRRRKRQAAFEGGGSVATTQQGVTGLSVVS